MASMDARPRSGCGQSSWRRGYAVIKLHGILRVEIVVSSGMLLYIFSAYLHVPSKMHSPLSISLSEIIGASNARRIYPARDGNCGSGYVENAKPSELSRPRRLHFFRFSLR